MEKEKTLTNFPEAFHPIVVVTGDRREAVPQSKADLLAYSSSVTDLSYIQYLNLGQVEIYSDKYFVLYDKETLKRRFGRKNLLVIGSPAVNLLARIINDDMLFRFNIAEDTKSKIEAQLKILDKIKFDQRGLAIYQQLLMGTASLEEAIIRTGHLDTEKHDLEKKYQWLFEEFAATELKSYKGLLHEFDRPGIWDPIEETIHGASPKGNRDYGLVSIAKHPYAEDDNFVAVCAAGVHGIATAQCVKLLANPQNFENRPYGGIVEIQMNPFGDWMDRFFDVSVTWETKEYEPRHPNVPPHLINVIHGSASREEKSKGSKNIYLSTPFNKDDAKQQEFNDRIRKICKEFHKTAGYACQVWDPYSLPTGGGAGKGFAEVILDHIRQTNYVIHDLTNLARGVLFEVGFALGLKKEFYLLWNNSRKRFDLAVLPELLKNFNVEACDPSDHFFYKILCEKIFRTSLQNGAVKQSDNSAPSLPRHDKALIKTSKSSVDTCELIAAALKSHDIDVLTKSDLPKLWEPQATIHALKSASYIFVDITENYYDGIIILGICKALNLENVLMLSRMGEDLAMWDGPKCHWSADETLKKKEIHSEVSSLIKTVQPRALHAH
ncbi:MAG: nucleoside 2-deoxyribosyltransferase [candidate division KSB1 bacterium]|nr:nucleoside 2-deoxyribosyltransferase [candidate division KSB1 bacterium]MDZ7301108.1 nucleoside 2-deoxyribosyltransferase [candidate division KSB1 bacterium]MDZ7312007.1 nucleoside 2-deoxyribosyltransferase [candidate division KSB1 bacterium]